jgi:hypothetical protein
MIIRAALAFLIATILPALAFALLTPVNGGGINTDIGSMLGLTFVFFPFSFAAAILFGVPLYLLLLKLKLVRWWSALASGAIVGLLVAITLRLPNALDPEDLLVDVPLGALAALVFWLVGVRGVTPNKLLERTHEG